VSLFLRSGVAALFLFPLINSGGAQEKLSLQQAVDLALRKIRRSFSRSRKLLRRREGACYLKAQFKKFILI
jgi:hypothetical protein